MNLCMYSIMYKHIRTYVNREPIGKIAKVPRYFLTCGKEFIEHYISGVARPFLMVGHTIFTRFDL